MHLFDPAHRGQRPDLGREEKEILGKALAASTHRGQLLLVLPEHVMVFRHEIPVISLDWCPLEDAWIDLQGRLQ